MNIDTLTRNSNSKRLKEITKEFHFTQLIDFPTRVACNQHKIKGFTVSSSLLDHIYVSSTDLYNRYGGMEFGGSDHKLIYVVRKKDRKVEIKKQVINYRCYKKKFMKKNFLRTLKL